MAAMVTAPLAEQLGDLTIWLPRAAALTTCPDTDGTSHHGKPGSRPPWNAQAANAVYDVCEIVRRYEQALRREVTGSPGRTRPYAATGTTIQAIADLAVNASPASIQDAARAIARLVTPMRQLPAIDLDERWRKVAGAACPYCQATMLRLAPRSGRVTCLRFGACYDRDGNHPVGLVQQSVSGQPFVGWADGWCQYADLTSENAS